MEPVVSCLATFENIPANSLTLSQVEDVAASLSQAISLYVGNTTPIATSAVAINANYSLASAPSPSRRHLLQSGNTLQSTVTFTATFAAATAASDATVLADIQAAVATAVSPLTVTTTALDVGSDSWNVTIVFPANNQVCVALPTMSRLSISNRCLQV